MIQPFNRPAPTLGNQRDDDQALRAYLPHPPTDLHPCPLAIAGGAARSLLRSGDRAPIGRACIAQAPETAAKLPQT